MDKYNGTFELLDPTIILIDHKYQRPEKWDLIAKISASPDWAAFGVIICAKRTTHGNDLYYCLDGQQRLQGVLTSVDPPKVVPVLSFAVSSIKEQARLFAIINEQRKAVNALEKYRAHITMEDPRYLQIANAAERAGFTIGGGSGGEGSRTIGAVQGLQEIYNAAGEDGVYIVLAAVSEAWPDEKSGTAAVLLRALGDIVAESRSNGQLTPVKLAEALARTSPGRVLRKAEEMRFNMGGSKRINLRRALKTLARI